MKIHPFGGVITAIITPFKNNELDLVSFQKLVEYQIDSGIKALIVGGSTGEGLLLSPSEYLILIAEAIKVADGRLKIIAGSSAPSTMEATSMLEKAQVLGVDGLMCTTPPYSKPSQEGLYQHFKAVHDATNLPIMLYANAGRAAVDFEDDTICKLAELPRVVALKDYDMERTLRLSVRLKDFALMSSDDITALSNRAHGGVGVASVLSNILPREVLAVQEAWDRGDAKLALKLFQGLVLVCKSMFVESNPVPVKYAASLMGFCDPEMRLPLCSLQEENMEKVRRALLPKYS